MSPPLIWLTGLTLRAYDTPWDEIELAGDADSLRKLADALSPQTRIAIGESDQHMRTIWIKPGDAKLHVSHDGRGLTVRGDATSLGHLANELRLVAAGPPQPSSITYHHHLESEPWLAESSSLLIIALKDSAT